MKKLLAFLSFSLCAGSASATILTLSNMPYSPGMYTTFAAAQAAAVDNDTIYVHGSNVNYGDIDVTKSIVIIGTGHHPDKQNALVSTFQFVNVFAESVQLIGLTFNYLFSGNSGGTIKKCRIRGGAQGYIAGVMLIGGNSWLVEGNVFDLNPIDRAIYFGNGAAPNTIVRNNIFSTYNIKIANLQNSLAQKTYFLNNVFIGNNSNNSFESIQGGVFDNNIFVASSPDAGSLISCEMNNNISFACIDNSFSQPGLNNLVDVNPEFENYPTLAVLFSYNLDFRLQNTSPGHNTGLDGTDRGVFGNIGYKFTMTGEPAIASITAFTITSPTTIPANGTLNISITSKRVH